MCLIDTRWNTNEKTEAVKVSILEKSIHMVLIKQSELQALNKNIIFSAQKISSQAPNDVSERERGKSERGEQT